MDKFKFWQKWFWIGLIVAIVSPAAGFIFSIALFLEPGRRKEGLTLLVAAIIVGIIYIQFIQSNPDIFPR
jgi:hypothetical protein